MFGGRKRFNSSFSSMYDRQQPPQIMGDDEQDSESLIVKLEYLGQMLAVLGEGLQFSASSIALRELQREQVTEDKSEMNH